MFKTVIFCFNEWLIIQVRLLNYYLLELVVSC